MMTIRSAIKRLQDLEAAHGDAEFRMLITEGEAALYEDADVTVLDKLVIDFHEVDGRRACFVMPQGFFETICDLTPKYRPII